MKDDFPHSGFRIDKIHVGAGFAGVAFTVGSLAIFLVGLPVLWYFLTGAVALGIGIAIVLHLRER
jgi:dolichyl-phosphate-mannose--protein O-mannosyl transferase